MQNSLGHLIVMQVEQLDLFALDDETPIPPVLNGFYYETKSRRFVSFVLGERYWEVLASRCRFDKEWQDKIMRERAM